MVVKGGLTNPRELIDNRVGGLVNVTRPDAISPMPQAPLNPFVFQLLEALDGDLEDNTGVSRLSQGLNKDAISKQNSAAMVEQLTTMSQQRQKIIARHFSSFLKRLYSEVYALVIENEDSNKIIEVAGSFVEIDPRSWKEKRDVVVEMSLGYGEADREAQKHLCSPSSCFCRILPSSRCTAWNSGTLCSRRFWSSKASLMWMSTDTAADDPTTTT